MRFLGTFLSLSVFGLLYSQKKVNRISTRVKLGRSLPVLGIETLTSRVACPWLEPLRREIAVEFRKMEQNTNK